MGTGRQHEGGMKTLFPVMIFWLLIAVDALVFCRVCSRVFESDDEKRIEAWRNTPWRRWLPFSGFILAWKFRRNAKF